MSRGSAWSLGKGEACLNRLGDLGDAAARGTGRGCRARDLSAAGPGAAGDWGSLQLSRPKRAPGAGPRGPDPSLRHEVLPIRQEDPLGAEGQGDQIPSLVTSFVGRRNEKDCLVLKEEFNKLEEVLTNKKTTFFGGSSLSMIDYLIWPWFEWLEALELNKCVDHTPKLKLWMAAMKEDPTVSALLTNGKALRSFLDLYLQNNPQACDFGL
ncbi:hypothetical protein MC885_020220 [Smutsia gigantea]|nr:hypothetical protein MC885_020220 [Smutsia gigantea]